MSVRSRTVRIALLGALLMVVTAIPGQAAGTTHWVDDDATAGPNGCGGAAVAPTSIQVAVDAAASGDTVAVCPGTYIGNIDVGVPGLTLTAVKPWTARIRPATVTATGTAGVDNTIIQVDANGVTVRWLRIAVPDQGCTQSHVGIRASGALNVKIRGNRIQGPKSTTSTVCGLSRGIHTDEMTGMVAWNTIRDWTDRAVVIEGGRVNVYRNSLHYRHPEATTCAAVCTGGPGPTAIGIRLQYTDSIAKRNHIESDSGAPFQIGTGIDIAGGDNQVLRNTLRRTHDGISAYDGADGRFAYNDIRAGDRSGIQLQVVETLEVDHNRITNQGRFGIEVNGADPTTTIHDNDARGNDLVDCHDGDAPSESSPTEAVWTDNLGDESYPDGICDLNQ